MEHVGVGVGAGAGAGSKAGLDVEYGLCLRVINIFEKFSIQFRLLLD